MIEHAIHAAGDIERYVLVCAAVVHSLSVLVLQEESLAAEIHLSEALSCSGKALVQLAFKRQCGTLSPAVQLAVSQRQGIIAWRREVVVGGESHLMFPVGIQSHVECLLWVGQQLAPSVEHRLLHVYHRPSHTSAVGNDPLVIHELRFQRQPFHTSAHLQHLRGV